VNRQRGVEVISEDRAAVLIEHLISRRRLLGYGLLAGIAAISGCGPKDGEGSQRSGGDAPMARGPATRMSNTDPCATRLQDIEGAIMDYYVDNRQLPAHLEDLRKMRGYSNLEFTCPVSNLPYIYNPIGIITADHQPRMICYDATPVHYGRRWVIEFVEERRDNHISLLPGATNVVLPPFVNVKHMPESAFTLARPRG